LFVVSFVEIFVFFQLRVVAVLDSGELVVGVAVEPLFKFREHFVCVQSVVVPILDQRLVEYKVVLCVHLDLEDLAPGLNPHLLHVHAVAHILDQVELLVTVLVDDHQGGGRDQGLHEVCGVQLLGVAVVGLVTLEGLTRQTVLSQRLSQHFAAGVAHSLRALQQVQVRVLLSH